MNKRDDTLRNTIIVLIKVTKQHKIDGHNIIGSAIQGWKMVARLAATQMILIFI